ncbi:hypothetical protein G7Y79_00021g049880 [Physcia stellaris]|nr:hypothetical protein G7Y79_00021g049880 [Physcia stellaris]
MVLIHTNTRMTPPPPSKQCSTTSAASQQNPPPSTSTSKASTSAAPAQSPSSPSTSPWSTIYLIDIFTLSTKAFDTPSPGAQTFRTILESPSVPKAFFGCRADLEALYARFQIKVSGVIDIQLLEVAQRDGEKRDKYDRLLSLVDCINKDCDLAPKQKEELKQIKEGGKSLYSPVHGGSYEVFNERPMRREIIEYCAQDVTFLPGMWLRYSKKITPEWAAKVEVETEKLVRQSQDRDFVFNEEAKKMSPWALTEEERVKFKAESKMKNDLRERKDRQAKIEKLKLELQKLELLEEKAERKEKEERK